MGGWEDGRMGFGFGSASGVVSLVSLGVGESQGKVVQWWWKKEKDVKHHAEKGGAPCAGSDLVAHGHN